MWTFVFLVLVSGSEFKGFENIKFSCVKIVYLRR